MKGKTFSEKGRWIFWSIVLVCCVVLAGRTYPVLHAEESTAVFYVLRSGSSGGLVRQLQEALQDLGYPVGTADGIYGSRTEAAVRQFQRDYGLSVDGIAGENTLRALGLLDDLIELEGIDGEDVYLLASVIHGEARGEPYEGQVAVGAVVLNRVESDNFPDTIAGVIYQNGAFDAVRDGQISLTPNETAIQAAIDALSGNDPTEGALYYWNPTTATSRWIWSVPITTSIGNHVFGTK